MKRYTILGLLALFVLSAAAFTASAHGFDINHLLTPEGLATLIAPAPAAAVLPEAIQAELKRIGEDIKSMADKAEKDIKAHARLSEETRAKVDELLTQQGALSANLQSAEQKLAQLEQGGGAGGGHVQSMGEQFTSNEEFQAWAQRPGTRFSMDVKNTVTSGGTSAGDLIVPDRVPGIVTPPMRRLTIRDLINWGRTSSNSVEFVRELVFTNNAAPVSENPTGTKPESNITFEADSAPVVTIAHWVHASKQVLADVPMLQSYIDGRLRAGLKLKEEDQLLNGSGVGLNIDGIYTQATAYSQPSGAVVDSETQLDRLRLALLQVALSEYAADGIVMHPTDWANVELLKTTDKAYLFANPRFLATPSLWGLPVVPTTAMTQSDFLVGTFGGGLAVQGWDREEISLSIATQDDRDFVKNMVKLLVEERLALTVYRPSAFVKGDFDGLPSS